MGLGMVGLQREGVLQERHGIVTVCLLDEDDTEITIPVPPS
jgi:hypothetical protein